MPHVDDARLHAYLDGELETLAPGVTPELESHVAACAVCAARLEEARRIRDRASAILRAAEPARLSLRDFESVAGFAGVASPRRPRVVRDHRRALQRRATALAWAASLVAALGIGWLARGVQDAREPQLASREIAIESPTSDPAAGAMPEEVTGVAEPARATRAPAADRAATASAAASGEARVAEAEPPSLAIAESVQQKAPGAPVALPAPPAYEATAEAPAEGIALRYEPERRVPTEGRVEAAGAVARGRVTGERGEAVPSAVVTIPSLDAVTLTAADGTYQLAIPAERLGEGALSLRVQRLGYRTETRPLQLAVGSATDEDFVLASEALALQELVATGAAPQRAERNRARAERLAAADARVAGAVAAEHDPGPGGLVGRSADACKRGGLPTLREAEATYFVAVALLETVPSGAGEARGQLFHLERVGGDAARQIQAGADRRTGEVVVIPWAVDAACRPVSWRGGWLEPGSRVFLAVRARSRDQWIGERPTVDAFHAAAAVYPEDIGEPAGPRSLTPDEFFDLYGALPTEADLEREPGRAVAALDLWEREHPDVARRPPAIEILKAVRAHAQRVRERSE